MKERNVTRFQGDTQTSQTSIRVITEEELRGEYAYEIVTDLLHEMLEKGLISRDEFNKIDAKNRESFSPHLVSLMPRST